LRHSPNLNQNQGRHRGGQGGENWTRKWRANRSPAVPPFGAGLSLNGGAICLRGRNHPPRGPSRQARACKRQPGRAQAGLAATLGGLQVGQELLGGLAPLATGARARPAAARPGHSAQGVLPWGAKQPGNIVEAAAPPAFQRRLVEGRGIEPLGLIRPTIGRGGPREGGQGRNSGEWERGCSLAGCYFANFLTIGPGSRL